nr:YdcF family protein [Corynebacterium pacaense]
MGTTLPILPGKLDTVRRKLLVLLGVVLVQPALRILGYSLVRRPNDGETIDSILVLGTAQYDGRPSKQFAARLRHTAELWHQCETQRVYTVGGKLPGDRFSEAAVGREFLLREGVDPDLIRVHPHGSDTRGSYADLDPREVGRVLIVTDPNHSYRAVRIARRMGFDAAPSPTPFSPTVFPSRSFFLTLLHESGGVVVLDVSAVFGQRVADRLEDTLRSLQAVLRPSRRVRHEQLRRLRD